MTHYVPCDLSVDTVTLNWYGIYDLEYNNWKYEPASEKVPYDHFVKFMKDGATVNYTPCCSMVSVSFSASRIANKFNCYEYTNNQYDYVKEQIEQAVYQATKLHLCFDEGIVSRFDVYKSVIMPSLDDCKKVIAGLQKQPTVGKYKRAPQEDKGERRYYKSGLTFNAYIKNYDPHIPEHIRITLPPTLRVEIQGRKNFRRKLLGKQVTAIILKYPAKWVQYYNDAINRFKLSGTVINQKDFEVVAAEVMEMENQRLRPSTITKNIQLLNRFISGDNKKHSKAIGLLNKIYDYDICPFPFYNPEIILNQTLIAGAVTSIEKQQELEYNEEILERALLLFRECLNRKEAKKCENIIHYTIYIIQSISEVERIIEIKDSS